MRTIAVKMTGSGHTFTYTNTSGGTITQVVSEAFQKLVQSKVREMLVSKIVITIR